MSDFHFNCPHCRQSLEAPGDMVGQLIDCPVCNQTIEVARKQGSPTISKARHTSPTGLNPNTPVFQMEGVGETLVVYSDKLEITPKGVLGFMAKGLKGTKTIPFFSITSIQFKQSGFTSGYLQFTIPGGNESRNGIFDAAIDENTFMFTGQNELAIKIKSYIELQIQESRRPQTTSSAPSVSGELERLAALRQQGILTDEEFQQAKSRLLR